MTLASNVPARLGALIALLVGTACSLPQASQSPLAAPPAPSRSYEPEVGQPGKDVVWVPTPDAVVERMLDMARVTKQDRVVDLGSGDGKIAIAAARRGARSLGIEFNPDMVALARRNAEAAGISNAQFVQGDIFASDFTDADVVTMYLLPKLNLRLRPILLQMKPGTRIASHDFTMGDWPPDESVALAGGRALFWRVPANVMGQWQVRIDGAPSQPGLQLELVQQYQSLGGSAIWGTARSSLRDATLSGGEVRFAVADPVGALHRFSGSAGHDGRMSGTVAADNGASRPFSATRTTPTSTSRSTIQ